MRAAAIIAGALLLSACSSDMSDLESYVAEVKSRTSRAIEPIPLIKQYESFTYEAAGRRDPFVPEPADTLAMVAGEGPRPDLNRNREPLEEYPLDALSMVGTIRVPAGIYALVRAPDSVIHRVTLKNHMGQNFGEIVAISESQISLLELVPDGFGGWVQREAALALAE